MAPENSDGVTVKTDVTLKSDQTQTPNVETYTKDQVEKMVRDARSAVGADVFRAKKAAEDALARLDRLETERQEADLEAAKDDPPELSRIKTEQENRRLKTELEKGTQELNEWRVEKATREKERTAREVATRLSLDPAELIEIAKFTDGTPEAIEAIAKKLPRGTKKSLKPDSGSMVGGTETWEQVRAAYSQDPRDPAIREKYLQMRRERKR